jgi:hypothetical protein
VGLQAGLKDLFDKDLPESVRGGQVLTGMTSSQARCPIAPTSQFGASAWERPALGLGTFSLDREDRDELCVIKSLHTEAINHEPAILQITTGNMFSGKPSLGAWLSYGLGAINDELPSFVVLTSKMPVTKNVQALSNRLWSSGFLSPEHAAVTLRPGGDPVLAPEQPGRCRPPMSGAR